MFSAIGTWATANYSSGNNNTGNLTVTGNWTTNSGTNITNGDRGNVVTGNTTVTNGNWPSGAQAVMAAAGVQSSGEPAASGPASSWVASPAGAWRCPTRSTTNGTQAQLWDCAGRPNQRWTHTAGKQLQVYGNKCLDATARAPPTAPR